jgi:hypothetical protein
LCADTHPDHDPICTFLREAQFEQPVEAVHDIFPESLRTNLRSDAKSDGLLELHRENCREPL